MHNILKRGTNKNTMDMYNIKKNINAILNAIPSVILNAALHCIVFLMYFLKHVSQLQILLIVT